MIYQNYNGMWEVWKTCPETLLFHIFGELYIEGSIYMIEPIYDYVYDRDLSLYSFSYIYVPIYPGLFGFSYI